MKIPPITIGSEGVIQSFLTAIGLTENTSTAITFNGEILTRGKNQYPVETVAQVRVSEAFMGITNPTVDIHFVSGATIEMPRIPWHKAKPFKDAIEDALKRIELEKLRAPLVGCVDKCRQARQEISGKRYLSQYALDAWLRKYHDLSFLRHHKEEFIRKNVSPSDDILMCRNYFISPKEAKKWRNERWIESELATQDGFFRSLSKHPPTYDQRIAMLTNDNRVLAVAGAGTGKTTTAVGKVAYLLHSGFCKPEEILLMTFARKAAEELRERITKVCGKGMEVRTFHSLGLDINEQATGIKPSVFAPENTEGLLNEILHEMEKTPKHRDLLASMATLHAYPSFSRHDFETDREYNAQVAKIKPKTLQDEPVKSNQERLIADWLYLKGISYRYEKLYEVKTESSAHRQYKPDFYLPDYGIYIEHWGLDENNKTARGIDQEKYIEGMKWKRKTHRDNKTRLVETYSWQEWDGSLFTSLEDQLKKMGVKIQPLSREKLKENEEYRKRFASLAKLLGTFLALYKSSTYELENIRRKAESRPRSWRRSRIFLDFFSVVLNNYEAALRERRELDVGDMIRRAVGYVRAGKYQSPFKVVIVDEFQDIAQGRSALMEALFRQTPDMRLFCVGDDWQSIYRFTGSDVQLMTNFTKTSQDSIQVNLSKTFRFNDRILGAASHFITRNPTQLVKKLEPFSKANAPTVHITKSSDSIEESLLSVLSRLSVNPNIQTVFVLARYRHVFNKIAWSKIRRQFPALKITRMTAHSSKGKEADVVIIMDMTSGKPYSFPSEIADDPIIDLLLAEPEKVANAEERRLFYVAITRARHEVWIPCPASAPSVFVKELLDDAAYIKNGWVVCESKELTDTPRCPDCGGIMVVRKKDQNPGLGCSNYPWCNGWRSLCPQCATGVPSLNKKTGKHECANCKWSALACPKCSTGWMVERTGKLGKFLGCSEFSKSKCKGTMPSLG